MDSTSDEESFVAVADFVATLMNEGQAKTALAENTGSKFLEECTALLAESRFDQYLSKMLLQLDLMFSKSSDKGTSALLGAEADSKQAAHLNTKWSFIADAECVANVLVHCIQRVPAEKVAPAVQAFAAALVAKVCPLVWLQMVVQAVVGRSAWLQLIAIIIICVTWYSPCSWLCRRCRLDPAWLQVDERAEERLGALLNLYGALQAHHTEQRKVLLAAADYARRGPRLAAMLVPAVRGKSNDWVAQWGLDEAQTRELLIALATLVKEYQRLVTAALGLCPAGDTAAITQLRVMAIAAITDFVRNTTLFQADFAASPAVQALANEPATQQVHALFTSMLSGDLASFRAAATTAALEAAGTNADAALSKARMLALLALCGKSSQAEVSYAEVEKALDVPPEAVEFWIVKAIGAKLLEAKIDQVHGVIAVSRCTQRTFGKPEWGMLRTQLDSWIAALKGVQSTIAAHTGNGAAATAALETGMSTLTTTVR
ncbi:PCI domain-containing protein, partial [Haematococcus lacustris]